MMQLLNHLQHYLNGKRKQKINLKVNEGLGCYLFENSIFFKKQLQFACIKSYNQNFT